MPSVGPPRVCLRTVLSIAAEIARRTLTSSNGFTVVFSEM
jgi:hypothetical protein